MREPEGAEVQRPPRAVVEGGKVRLRLELFEEARGFPEPAAQARLGAARPRRSRRRDEAATAIAATYAATAELLQAPPGRSDDAAGPHGRSGIAPQAPGAAPAGPAPAVPTPPRWRSLGPTVMHGGQTYGSGPGSRVDVSGRVAAIAVDPSNSSHVLVGSAGGGIWETRDGGTTWAARTDAMPTLTTGAIAFDPANPTTVYGGTGEGNFYARLGAGLLRSTDGGATWAVHASAPFVGRGFFDLIVDAGTPTRLFAGVGGGLFVSTDGGSTWTPRRTDTTWSISYRTTTTSSELLAATPGGLFRSTNRGQTWTAVSLPGAPSSWMRLAVAHARSDPRIAYAFGADGGATRGYLWRRNATGTWAAVTLHPDLAGSGGVGQSWYDWYVAVSPDNPGQVYLGAINLYRGNLAGTAWTWTNLSAKTAGDSIHPDQHAIAFDPANPAVVYAGNDGGLYRSPDRGTHWQAQNNGLAITEIEYLAQDMGSCRWLLGGTQDNGSIRYTGSPVWDHAADGDGGDCGVNRSSPATVYHSYYGMGMERSTARGNPGTWSWLGPNVPNGYGALFYPPMEVSGATVAQGGQSVFVSRNGGSTWTEATFGVSVTSSAMDMPSADRILVGTTNGRLFRLDWSGSAWAVTTLSSPRTAWISDLASHPGGRLWATSTSLGGGRVFRSDDGGITWTDLSAGLPPLPVNSVCVDPGNASRVWVAADLGVFQTLDGGATWSPFSLGLPNVLVADLLFHPHARLLRAGTRNRGVWEIEVDGALASPLVGVQFVGPLTPNQSRTWFTHSWPATWHVIWTVVPTTPQPGAAQISWSTRVERASAELVTYWITIKNLTAAPVAIEARYAVLSRC